MTVFLGAHHPTTEPLTVVSVHTTQYHHLHYPTRRAPPHNRTAYGSQRSHYSITITYITQLGPAPPPTEPLTVISAHTAIVDPTLPRLCESSAFHSPQPLGWGLAAPRMNATILMVFINELMGTRSNPNRSLIGMERMETIKMVARRITRLGTPT